MSATGLVDRVRTAVEAVPDPELPPVTIGMLGMLHDLVVEDDGQVRVTLLPTFAGCPAIEMIRDDVVSALGEVAGVTDVQVEFRYTPVWTPARIDDEGRRRLAEFGIAPPLGASDGADGAMAGGVEPPDSVVALPIVAVVEATSGRACPWCGSTDTERDSAFGPTPCRDLWMCADCRQPFEGFKSA